jgi:hypothetical protein
MKGQVLIIDDNRMDIKIATNAIERLGFSCFGFEQHQQAIEWLSQNIPNIIILDLQMPKVTGYDLNLFDMPVDLFGTDKLMLRCLSSDRLREDEPYIMQLTFIGLNETQRQFIRKSCRQVWSQLKQEAL